MRFVPNPLAEFEVKDSPEAAKALLQVVEAAAGVAVASAPYDTRPGRDPTKPHYRDQMRVTVRPTPVGFQGILYNKDYKAHWIERGTGPPGPTPAFHTLFNSLRAIGLAAIGD